MSTTEIDQLETKLNELPDPETLVLWQDIAELRGIAAEIAPLAAELKQLEQLLRGMPEGTPENIRADQVLLQDRSEPLSGTEAEENEPSWRQGSGMLVEARVEP